MELTPQRKVFIAILALAGGGLLVDRFVLGSNLTEPAGASAESLVPEAKAERAAPVPGPVQTLSERLESLPKVESISAEEANGFASPSWLASSPNTVVNAQGDVETVTPVVPPSIRLTAVIAGANALAVIDGKSLRPGDSLPIAEGVTITLREVTTSGVIIETQGRLFRVDLRN